MTILVDEARWPWRDTYWCHLVSNDNLAELHEFARDLGCRRVGFQGDHYDIDVKTREQAIALGAVECDSRELVRQMKTAGLRLRPSQFTKWSLVERGEPPQLAPLEAIPGDVAPWRERSDGYFVLNRTRRSGEQANAVVMFGSNASTALPIEDPDAGLFVRTTRDGDWAIEFITPTPLDTE